MSNVLKEILSMSLSGSILILLILTLKPILKERFSKTWQYYIWIVVLIRFILPFSPEFGVIDNLFQPVATYNSTETESSTQDVYIHTGENSIQTQPNNNLDETNLTAVHSQNNKLPLDGWRIGGYLWLTGMVIIIFIKQIRYLHFLMLMNNNSEPVADKRIQQIYNKAAGELGITKRPQLKVNSMIASPMLMGLLKPAIYLTDITVEWDDISLYYVLRHELMHYKRHDLWYKWCSSLVLCAHWFNPLVIIMGRQINSQCETSCDEAVVRDLSKEEKLVYGNVLLNAISLNIKKYSPMLSSTLYEDKKTMKERMKSIIMSKPKSKKTIILSALVTIILCIAAFWLGAYTMGGKNTGINTASAASGTPDGTANGTEAGTSVGAASNTAANDTGSQTGDNQNSQSNTAINDNANNDNDTGNTKDSQNASDNNTVSQDDNGGTASESTDNSKTPSKETNSDSTSTSEDTLTYSNSDYGFNFALPSDWKGYSIVKDTWQGTAISGKQSGNVTESGVKILLRHPKWTKENPYQDIPIMIFTKKQWKLVNAEELAVSAAPIGPSKLGENSKYVFALPARYNFAFPTGYKEVEKIMDSKPLVPTEKFQ